MDRTPFLRNWCLPQGWTSPTVALKTGRSSFTEPVWLTCNLGRHTVYGLHWILSGLTFISTLSRTNTLSRGKGQYTCPSCHGADVFWLLKLLPIVQVIMDVQQYIFAKAIYRIESPATVSGELFLFLNPMDKESISIDSGGAWCQTSDRPLSEPMLTYFPDTNIHHQATIRWNDVQLGDFSLPSRKPIFRVERTLLLHCDEVWDGLEPSFCCIWWHGQRERTVLTSITGWDRERSLRCHPSCW